MRRTCDPKAEARGYLFTLLALLFLTIITVGASYIDFGQGNVVIALAIATVKATLVALFFMHLAHDKPVNGLIAVAGFIFLGLFLMFDLIDINTRRDAIPQNLGTLRRRKPLRQFLARLRRCSWNSCSGRSWSSSR